jgi:imidazole glycerol phosphate synthase subunit HisF
MLYRRLIPKIVVESAASKTSSGYHSILTRAYEPHRIIGDPLSQIRIQQSNLVDEIVLVNRCRIGFVSNFSELVLQACEILNTPLTVGGAITETSHVEVLFGSGADKVIIGRNRSNLELLESIASKHGVQALVISVDYSENDLAFGPEAFWERELSLGYLSFAGEICLNNVSRDGGGAGVDLRIVDVIHKETNIPIVVGCGISTVNQISECFKNGCDAVTLSTFLSQTDQSIKQIRSHLSALGVHIRTRN